MNTLKRFNSLFTLPERVTLAVLVLLLILNSILEVFGIGLLLPYGIILQDPGKATRLYYISWLYKALGFRSDQAFLIAMSIGLFSVFLAKGVFSLWITNFQFRFIHAKQTKLGQALLLRYFSWPYALFLSTNTSILIGNLTTTLQRLCDSITQMLALIAETIALLGLSIFLIYVSPGFSLLAIAFVGALSIFFIRILKPNITRYALDYDQRVKGMIRVVNEGMSAVKEIQVLGREQFFVDSYGRESRSYTRAARRYTLLMQMPRIVLEAAAAGCMILFAISIILTGGFQGESLSVLAVFAVVTIRILPSAQRILQAANAISFFRPSVDAITSELAGSYERALERENPGLKLRFRETLVVSIKSFKYPGNSHFSLKDICFSVRKGQTVAFIGHSGSGKTTLIDLILGVFPEFEGKITVDGLDIRNDIRTWQGQIGYIPQKLYLLDDTITRNVALGIPDSEINMARVKRAITLAGLDGVIQTQWGGLDTIVGDRGIRLSGGEQQRIGIARALYHDPDLLILDEATSALDVDTESQIVDSILRLSPSKTVMIIAHRLSTVSQCDCVFLMSGGQIIDSGPFDQVAKQGSDFANIQPR
jgi:ABC-type multidrug transport system fused ATPase/permease subunit